MFNLVNSYGVLINSEQRAEGAQIAHQSRPAKPSFGAISQSRNIPNTVR